MNALGSLAGFVVVDTDHCCVGDTGVRQQQAFELSRRHLEALVLDEFLDPVDDEDVAVVVEVSNVAGVQPAIGIDRLRGGLIVVQVPLHDLRATNPQFTIFVDADSRCLRGRRCDTRCSRR